MRKVTILGEKPQEEKELKEIEFVSHIKLDMSTKTPLRALESFDNVRLKSKNINGYDLIEAFDNDRIHIFYYGHWNDGIIRNNTKTTIIGLDGENVDSKELKPVEITHFLYDDLEWRCGGYEYDEIKTLELVEKNGTSLRGVKLSSFAVLLNNGETRTLLGHLNDGVY